MASTGPPDGTTASILARPGPDVGQGDEPIVRKGGPMSARSSWRGGFLVSMATCAVLAGAVLAGNRRSRAEPEPLAPDSACTPSWQPTFGGNPGANADVHALAAFADGGGPALYVGGEFTAVGDR